MPRDGLGDDLPERDLFHRAVGPRFSMPLRYWFPTGRMLRDYGAMSVPLRLGRAALGWAPVSVPSGLSRHLGLARGVLSGQISPAFVDRWRSVSARYGAPGELLFAPQEFLSALMPADWSDVAVRVEIDKAHRLCYCIVHRQPAGGGLYARRYIRPQSGDCYHDLLFADPGGRGLANELLFQAMQFYIRLGIREVRLKAGYDVGGLLWPKFGFRPETSADWKAIHPQIRRNFAGLPEALRQQTGNTLNGILSRTSGSGALDPRSIWLISRWEGPAVVGPDGSPRKLGDVLLQGTKWPGVLKLEDEWALSLLCGRLGAERGEQLRKLRQVGVG